MELDISIATLSEFDEKGSLRISPDLHGSDPGEPSGRAFLSIQPLGIIARPRDPAVDANGRPTNGANLLYSFIGSDGFAMPLTDPRFLDAVPPIKKGGFAIYSAPGTVVNIDGDDGAFSVLVPIDAQRSKNHLFQIDPASPANIQLNLANGPRVMLSEDGTKPAVISNHAGDAYLQVDDTGITFNGNTTFNGGMVMGEIASALPVSLFPAWNAWAQAVTQLAVQAAKDVVALAPDPSIAGLIATAQALALALTGQGQSTKLSASP